MSLSKHDFSISDQHHLNDYKNIQTNQENSLSSLLASPISENNSENSDSHQMYQQHDYSTSNANDYGLGSSTQSIEDDLTYGPFEKLCRLCDDPTPMNM